jgi:hypothetical protein
MNDQFTDSARQQYLAGVTDLSKETATACDHPLGVSIAWRRFTGMKCETNRPSDTASGSLSGDRILDVESEGERIGCTVETCEETLVFALEGSRPSMATEEILEEGVQSLDNGGSVWNQRSRSDRSRRVGGQDNRHSCRNAPDQINPGQARLAANAEGTTPPSFARVQPHFRTQERSGPTRSSRTQRSHH